MTHGLLSTFLMLILFSCAGLAQNETFYLCGSTPGGALGLVTSFLPNSSLHLSPLRFKVLRFRKCLLQFFLFICLFKFLSHTWLCSEH